VLAPLVFGFDSDFVSAGLDEPSEGEDELGAGLSPADEEARESVR
jgi:hypothetical protein